MGAHSLSRDNLTRVKDVVDGLVNSGNGDLDVIEHKVRELLARFMANEELSYAVVLSSFSKILCHRILSKMRSKGEVETVGKHWKPVADITPEEADVIVDRRLKDMEGRLSNISVFAHDHGNHDVVAAANTAKAALLDAGKQVEDLQPEFQGQVDELLKDLGVI